MSVRQALGVFACLTLELGHHVSTMFWLLFAEDARGRWSNRKEGRHLLVVQKVESDRDSELLPNGFCSPRESRY